VIAVIPKTTAIDYWESLHAGAQMTASARKLRVLWNGPQSETDFAGQASMLEGFIRMKVDGIVLAPSHGYVLASAVRHAKAEGIPLVLVDSPVMTEATDYSAYIGSEPERMGRLAAERMGAILQSEGEIAMIGVSPTVEAAVQREKAFSATMAAKFPGIRIVDLQYGLSNHARAREIAEDIMAARVNLKAIFASDEFAVRGAFIALRNNPWRGVRLIGVAQEQDLLNYLDHGLIDSLVVQDPYSMGRLAVGIVGDLLSRGYSGPRRIETRVELATQSNLKTALIDELVSHHPILAERAAPFNRAGIR